DSVKAGGEPLVLHSTRAGNLVYTSHEGTTHIDREGLPGTSIVQFLCPGLTTVDCYKNHVWIWTSDDRGKTWQARDEGLSYTGFSDPDLTEDAAGSIYNTGIDLANESVFSSQDGGKTWPHGTTNCAPGDRPWLAGGVAGEVYMATDPLTSPHTVYRSTNSADSCGANGVRDAGTLPDGTTWSGYGKLAYDRFDGSLVEPAVFTHGDGSIGVGYSRLPRAGDAFSGGGEHFQPVEVMGHTSVFSPFGAPEKISFDAAQNTYFAWDTDARAPNTTGGCNTSIQSNPYVGGGNTPLPNQIMLATGKYISPGLWTFSTPVSIAHQGEARVEWPWTVAGSDGNVSVVWYQMDKMVDPDCDLYNGVAVPDVKTYIYKAHITSAVTAAGRAITVTNASGRFIHQGGICNSGTTCVATGQDRRLGDFFTNAVDENGCVLIASGDTTVLDVTGQPRATSLPIFIRQNSGPSLTGLDCGAVSGASSGGPGGGGTPDTGAGAPPGPTAIFAAAVLGLGLLALLTRRRGGSAPTRRPPRTPGSGGSPGSASGKPRSGPGRS
ncbi:MAG: sialidase family protein, partial [Candidatus Dormibacteria bacterium]